MTSSAPLTPSARPAVDVTVRRWTARAAKDAVRITLLEGPYAHLRARRKRAEWRPIKVRPELAQANHVVVTAVKDERLRLSYLLDYYRGLGVDHFIVIDNKSSDGTQAYLQSQVDVSLFLASGDYGASRYAVDWVNGILKRYCVGKWILWVDADELLVFSRHDVPISQLTDTLERLGRRSLQTVMIDMYSGSPSRFNVLREGQDPREVCGLFDSYGYSQTYCRDNHTSWIKGGVRRRVFFKDAPETAPALNKTPLVRWSRHYAFLKSVHQLWPSRVNGGLRLGGALLHFKFTQVAAARIVDPAHRTQHTTEYDAYGEVADVTLVGDPSSTLRGVGTLIDLRIIDPYV